LLATTLVSSGAAYRANNVGGREKLLLLCQRSPYERPICKS
jgi:hypothetical protein